MQINRTPKYEAELLNILKTIAKDKIGASKKFQQELDRKVDDLINFPFKFRQSFYFDDKNIRDMVFKRYTIVYEVDFDKESIDILNIFNRNIPYDN
jgi:plasmid stabilization system protein ParE